MCRSGERICNEADQSRKRRALFINVSLLFFFFLHPRFPLDVRREKRKIPPSSLSSTRRMSARKMNERVCSRREEKKTDGGGSGG